MKTKKTKYIVTVCVILILSFSSVAFADTCMLNEKSDNKCEISEINYEKTKKGGEATFYLNINSSGKNFEIANDFGFYKNNELTEKYDIIESEINNNQISYKVNIDNKEESVYVKKPTIFFWDNIEKLEAKLNAKKNDNILLINNRNWIKFNNISISEINSHTIVNFEFIADEVKDISPRKPKLMIGNEKINGSSSIIYDENLNLRRGVLSFIIPENLKVNSETDYNIIIDSILIKQNDNLIEKRTLQ